MLKCLKSYADWEPEAAKEYQNKIDQNLADEAGVDLETFHSAKNIIWWDGHYGPYTNEDYAEEGHKITKDRALEIIEAARQYRFEDIEFQNPEFPPECDCDQESEDPCMHNNCVISGSTIYNEVWHWWKQVYG